MPNKRLIVFHWGKRKVGFRSMESLRELQIVFVLQCIGIFLTNPARQLKGTYKPVVDIVFEIMSHCLKPCCLLMYR